MSAQAEPKDASNPVALFSTAAVVLAADQLAKLVALAHLSEHQSITLIPRVLHLTLVRNPGGAFGMRLPQPWGSVILIGACAAAALVIALGHRRYAKSRGMAVLLGLIMGGALGNLVDRLLRGGLVVDFVDLRIWPVFNIADAAITVSVVIILWLRVREEINAKRNGAKARSV